jgi:hypothetical protein
MSQRRLASLILASLAIGAVAACSPDRAVSTTPMGDPAYGVQLLLSPTNLPRGTARFPDPDPAFDTPPTVDVTDTIGVDLAGLDSLTNGVYSVWISNDDGSSIFKATGTLRVIVTDTVLDAFGDPVPAPDTVFYTDVSAFSNGGPRHAMQFLTTLAQSGMTADDSATVVFITIESDAGATSPAETRRPLWARKGGTAVVQIHIDTLDTDPVLVTDTTFDRQFLRNNLTFGNFSFDASQQYVYVATARGQAFVRGDVLLMNDSSLTRPPLGYYYAGFGVIRNEANEPVDTVYLGPLSSPPPNRHISLRDADSVLVNPDVQVLVNPPNLAGSWSNPSPSAILAASIRVSADTISAFQTASGPFVGLAEVFLTIESKHAEAGRMGPAILLRANVPDIVRFGSQ